MELKGKITLLVDRQETTIEIKDSLSSVVFAKIKLTPEQLSAALSRQEMVECDV